MADFTIPSLTNASTLEGDEELYIVQSGADRKVTPDQLRTHANENAANLKATGYLELSAMTAPTTPGDGKARIYVEDDGTGKYRAIIVFPDSNRQILALQTDIAASFGLREDDSFILREDNTRILRES